MEWYYVYTSLDVISLLIASFLMVVVTRSKKLPGNKWLLAASLAQIVLIYLLDLAWIESPFGYYAQELLQVGIGAILFEYLSSWINPAQDWRKWIPVGIGALNLSLLLVGFLQPMTVEAFFQSVFYHTLSFANILVALGYMIGI